MANVISYKGQKYVRVDEIDYEKSAESMMYEIDSAVKRIASIKKKVDSKTDAIIKGAYKRAKESKYTDKELDSFRKHIFNDLLKYEQALRDIVQSRHIAGLG